MQKQDVIDIIEVLETPLYEKMEILGGTEAYIQINLEDTKIIDKNNVINFLNSVLLRQEKYGADKTLHILKEYHYNF